MARSTDEILADFEKMGIPADLVKQELTKRGVNLPVKQQSVKDTVINAAKNAVALTPVGGIANTLQGASNAFNQLPAAAQQAITVGAGQQIGETLAGPLGAGAGAATMGGLTEAAQNPHKASEILGPLAKTAMSPTPANVANVVQTGQQNEQGIKDFMTRRAMEGGAAAATSGLAKWTVGKVGKPTGPISATFDNPSLVRGSIREKILQELGTAKDAAMSGDNLAEAARLRSMLGGGPAKNIKLAEEAIDAVKTGKELSNTQLLAYEEALGKTQTRGGTFANVYAGARKAIREMLKEQAPNVAKYKTLARNVFLAQGEGEAPVTSLIDAIRNPMTQAAKNPSIQRAFGAGSRIALESASPIAASAVAALDSLAQRRKK